MVNNARVYPGRGQLKLGLRHLLLTLLIMELTIGADASGDGMVLAERSPIDFGFLGVPEHVCLQPIYAFPSFCRDFQYWRAHGHGCA